MAPPLPGPRKRADAQSASPADGADLETLSLESAAEWDAWLARNGAGSPGVWLRLAKKGSGLRTPTYQEAVDVALCYGWIDSQKGALDAVSSRQRFTPRGPRSLWSARNRARALELIAAGRMRPAGHAAIERARENGQWDAAYDSHRTAVVPPDLEAALERSPEAKAFFSQLTSQNRYAILFRIQTARRAETRRKRIAQFVGMLERHETLHPQARGT